VRHWYARQRRRGDGGTDSRDHLERKTRRCQRERFFSTAAEDERVATLQSHDPAAAACRPDQQPDDELLADGRTPGAFPDENPLGRRRKIERIAIHERVVEDEVGLREALDRTPRQQVGIARTRTHERDESPASRHSRIEVFVVQTHAPTGATGSCAERRS
jgi:hypothetical protein